MRQTLANQLDDDSFEDVDIHMQVIPRSQLHRIDVLKWLRKRFKNSLDVKKKYIYLPEEVRRNIDIKNAFINIDKDGSKALSITEILELMNEYHFDIQKEEMEKLFAIVDEDHDLFTGIMRRIKKKQMNQKQGERLLYVPVSFSTLIQYISYCSTRDELMHQMENDTTLNANEQFALFMEMFQLTNQYQEQSEKKRNNRDDEFFKIQQQTQNQPDFPSKGQNKEREIQKLSKKVQEKLKIIENDEQEDRTRPPTIQTRDQTPNSMINIGKGFSKTSRSTKHGFLSDRESIKSHCELQSSSNAFEKLRRNQGLFSQEFLNETQKITNQIQQQVEYDNLQKQNEFQEQELVDPDEKEVLFNINQKSQSLNKTRTNLNKLRQEVEGYSKLAKFQFGVNFETINTKDKIIQQNTKLTKDLKTLLKTSIVSIQEPNVENDSKQNIKVDNPSTSNISNQNKRLPRRIDPIYRNDLSKNQLQEGDFIPNQLIDNLQTHSKATHASFAGSIANKSIIGQNSTIFNHNLTDRESNNIMELEPMKSVYLNSSQVSSSRFYKTMTRFESTPHLYSKQNDKLDSNFKLVKPKEKVQDDFKITRYREQVPSKPQNSIETNQATQTQFPAIDDIEEFQLGGNIYLDEKYTIPLAPMYPKENSTQSNFFSTSSNFKIDQKQQAATQNHKIKYNYINKNL